MSVEVNEADWEAAYEFTRTGYMGGSDGIELLAKIVAAHRHQAEEAMRERAAAVAMNLWHPSYVKGDLSDPNKWKPGSPYDRGQVDACERIAAAIRSIDTRGE